MHLLLLSFSLLAVLGLSEPQCSGRSADPRQCDAYTDCRQGVPTPALCPEGLVFSPSAAGYPCLYPQQVDCTGRPALQPAQPTTECPHQFGLYRLGDANNCGLFMSCVHGKAFTFSCPEGLAFSEESLQCDWPDLVSTCNPEAETNARRRRTLENEVLRAGQTCSGVKELAGDRDGCSGKCATSYVPSKGSNGLRYLGFNCPVTYSPLLGWPGGFRLYRSPRDCGAYFLCERDRPRLLRCPQGKAFNEVSSTCDDPANVTGCYGPGSAYSNSGGSNQVYVR